MKDHPRDADGKFTVPLVDRTGDHPRTIGEAEVYLAEHGDNVEWYEAEMTVTDEEFLKALKPKTGSFSIAPETFRE